MAATRKAKPKASASTSEKKPSPDSASKPKPKPKAAKSESKPKPKSSSSKSHSSEDTYTDPKLRDRLKAEITAGDKGGKPGQWSARKAQLLAHEYEKAGGDYKNGEKKKTESQRHLDSWTEEDWKTSDGKPADREGGTTRYLPDKAWEELTPAQKKATNDKKQAGSNQGKQFVANTEDAKTARKSSSKSSPSDSATKSKPKAQTKPKTKAATPKARKKSSE